jgi:hypothetical protein
MHTIIPSRSPGIRKEGSILGDGEDTNKGQQANGEGGKADEHNRRHYEQMEKPRAAMAERLQFRVCKLAGWACRLSLSSACGIACSLSNGLEGR